MRFRMLGLLTALLLISTNLSFAAATPAGLTLPTYCTISLQSGNYGGGVDNAALTNVTGLFPYNYTTAIAIALLALTVSFDVVAIAYAIGRLFPHLGIRNWVQNEYWEIAKSALVIVSIYAVITLISNIAIAITPGLSAASTGPSAVNLAPLIKGAESYLCNVNYNVVNMWEFIGTFTAGNGFYSSLQVSLFVPLPLPEPFVGVDIGVLFPVFPNWALQAGNYLIAPFGSIINDIVNFVLYPYTAMEVGLIELLPIMAYIGLSFFIPLGLVFRALPFIRGIGGTLIAIGIAMSVVLPGVLLLFNYPVTQAMSSALPLEQPPFSYAASSATNGCPIGAIPIAGHVICAIFSYVSSWFGNMLSGINLSTLVFSTSAIYQLMNYIFQYGLFMILQFVLLAIDIIIIYPIVDNIARMLGGTIRLSLGGKLKLAS